MSACLHCQLPCSGRRLRGIPDLPVVDVVAQAEAFATAGRRLVRCLVMAYPGSIWPRGAGVSRARVWSQRPGQGGAIPALPHVWTERFQQRHERAALVLCGGLRPGEIKGWPVSPLHWEQGSQLTSQGGP